MLQHMFLQISTGFEALSANHAQLRLAANFAMHFFVSVQLRFSLEPVLAHATLEQSERRVRNLMVPQGGRRRERFFALAVKKKR